jgi:Transmembrane secretion effector
MRLLGMKPVRLFLVGFLCSVLAQWTLRIGVLLWIYARSSSGMSVSLVGLAEALPLLVLAPFAGMVVDRLPYGTVLPYSSLIAVALTASLLASPDSSGLGAILAVMLALGGATQFFTPAAGAAAVALAGRDEGALGRINTLVELCNSVVVVLAPPLAAALFGWFGSRGLLVTVIGLWCMSLIPFSLLTRRATTNAGAAVSSSGGGWWDGVLYLWRTPVLRSTVLAAMVALLGGGGLAVLDVVYVTRALHQGPQTVGLLLAAGGAGQFCGGVILLGYGAVLARRCHLLFGIALLVDSWLLAGYALAPSLAWAAVALFSVGVAYTAIMVGFSTLVQLATVPGLLGRVLSVVNAVVAVALLFSYALSGVLADQVGIRQVVGLAACSVGIAAIIALKSIRETPNAGFGDPLASEPGPHKLG